MKDVCGANTKQSSDCYQCLSDWCDEFLWHFSNHIFSKCLFYIQLVVIWATFINLLFNTLIFWNYNSHQGDIATDLNVRVVSIWLLIGSFSVFMYYLWEHLQQWCSINYTDCFVMLHLIQCLGTTFKVPCLHFLLKFNYFSCWFSAVYWI